MRREEAGGAFYFLAQLCLLALTMEGQFLWLLLGMAVHELGHLGMMAVLRVPVDRVRVSPGGIRVGYRRLLSPGREAAVLLAGPGINLLLGAALWWRCPQGAVVQLLTGGYQLLPICGSDGGSLCGLLLCCFYPPEQAERLCRRVSGGCCLLLFFAAAAGHAMGYWDALLPAMALVLWWYGEKRENGFRKSR